MTRKRLSIGLMILVAFLSVGAAGAQEGGPSLTGPEAALDTAFAYQGQLRRNNSPVTATCDMAFRLYNDASVGASLGSVTTTAVPVLNGLFTVSLDFGASAFDGGARWLETAVKCGNDADFTTLAPRQRLTAAPQALFALLALYSQNANLLDGRDSTAFASSGHGHSGADIVSGTVAAARIDPAIARDAEIMPIVLANDGANSGLNADMLDGLDSAAYWKITGNGGVTTTNFLGTTDNRPLIFKTNGVEALRVDSNGNVGIGTATPNTKLEIRGGVVPVNFQIKPGAIDNTGTTNAVTLDIVGVVGTLRVWDNLSIANNVGIGTTNPGRILTVQQGSATDPVADGWNTYSSRRWKTHIRPIRDALDKVLHLRGVTFEWQADGKPDIGLIAEEVGEVIPEVVQYEANGVEAQSLDYTRLVAVLIEATKEQQQQIDDQQRQLESQQTRLAVLEKQNTLLAARLSALEQHGSVPLSPNPNGWLILGGLAAGWVIVLWQRLVGGQP